MKNNKGFGKFEVITMMLLLIVIFAFAFYMLLNGANGQRLSTMKENAVTFSKTVSTNIASFHNTNYVYLQEAVDEKLLKGIKNPFGKGNCSESESFIHIKDGLPYTTLRCGNMLIDDANLAKDIQVYEISEWSETKKNDDDDEMTFYNCTDGDKEVFDKYYEELYFIYMLNKKYGTNYYYHDTVSVCKVETKQMYRSKTLLEEKK